MRPLIEPPLVGRDAEVEALVDAVGRPPMLVSIEGEAGSGKTRLIQELGAGRRVLIGRCTGLDAPLPLGPVIEALRCAAPAATALGPVSGTLRPWLPELAAVLPPEPEPVVDPGAARHRLLRAAVELLGALGSVTVVLEDLHRADSLTLDLLPFVAARMPDSLALVCTWRPEDLPTGSGLPTLAAQLPPAAHAVRIELDPLDSPSLRRLAANVLGVEGISDEFAAQLHACTGGVPLAIVELLRLVDADAAAHDTVVRLRRDLDELALPVRLRAAVAERLGQIGQDARATVEAAAVFEAPVAERTLLRVAGLGARHGAAALAEALSAGLLLAVSDARYSFRHAIARRVVESDLPAPERRRLHARAAAALEAEKDTPPAALARHYHQAGIVAKWISYTEQAADRATSLDDHVVVYRLLREAVRFSGLATAKRGGLAVRLALHASRCYEQDDAIRVVRPLVDGETLPAGLRGELRLRLGVLLHNSGDSAGGFAEISRAVKELRRRPAVAARAMAMLAAPAFTEGPVDEHLHWLDRAVTTAERSKDPVVRIAVAADRAAIQLGLGDPEGWRSLELVPLPGHNPEEVLQAARCCANVSDALIHTGHYERARREIKRGLEFAARAPASRGTHALPIGAIELDWLTGRWAGLADRARESAEAWREWPGLEADARVVLALLCLARGDVRDATEVFETYRDEFSGEAQMRTWIDAALTRIRLAEDRPDAAVEEAGRGLELIRRKAIWVWAAEVAPPAVAALISADRRDEAIVLTRDFEAGLRGRDAPASSAALLTCRAILDGGARAYLKAERAWRALPRPYEAAHAREAAGTCLLPNELERGREHLVAALEAYRRLGADWDAARVTGTLRKHGVIPPHRRGRKGYGGGLTPRESDVVRLAADGLTNREIAVALVLSRKTVEHYLGSAMRKLGVTSRNDLAPHTPVDSRTAEKQGVPLP